MNPSVTTVARAALANVAIQMFAVVVGLTLASRGVQSMRSSTTPIWSYKTYAWTMNVLAIAIKTFGRPWVIDLKPEL